MPGGNPRDQVASQRKCTDIAISEKSHLHPEWDSNPRPRGQSLEMLSHTPGFTLISFFFLLSSFFLSFFFPNENVE